jgi:hypothetical protein
MFLPLTGGALLAIGVGDEYGSLFIKHSRYSKET